MALEAEQYKVRRMLGAAQRARNNVASIKTCFFGATPTMSLGIYPVD